VTKKEIVKQLCDKANKEKLLKGSLTQLATKEIVQWTFDAIIETLVAEGRIELRNFGVFEVKQRKPRKARNPRTGDRVDVAAKNVVTFQPGKEMEERCASTPDRSPRSGNRGGDRRRTTRTTMPRRPLPRGTGPIRRGCRSL
jgi:nucleoid DNA-binding protein